MCPFLAYKGYVTLFRCCHSTHLVSFRGGIWEAWLNLGTKPAQVGFQKMTGADRFKTELPLDDVCAPSIDQLKS